MKTCIYCGETKPLNEYHASDRAADGHRPECRACRTERAAGGTWVVEVGRTARDSAGEVA